MTAQRRTLNLSQIVDDFDQTVRKITRFLQRAIDRVHIQTLDRVALYNIFVNGHISEYCNDASLCLAEILATRTVTHPDDLSEQENHDISRVGLIMMQFKTNLSVLAVPYDVDVLRLFDDFKTNLGKSFKFTRVSGRHVTVVWNFETLCTIFLQLAVELEGKFAELSDETEEDELSYAFAAQLNLNSANSLNT